MADNYLRIDGWELEHTGGNCTGLTRATDTDGGHWFMTDGDPNAPETMTEPVALTLYGADGFALESVPYPTAGAALVAVAASEGRAVDIISRAISVITESDLDAATDPDGHAPILAELRALIGVKL